MLKSSLFNIKKNGANGEVLKRLLNYSITNFSLKAVGLISLPIITRIFTIEEFGIYSTYLTILSISVTILGLNLPHAVMRYYYEELNDFQEFVNSIFYFLILSFLVVFIITYCFSDYIIEYFKVSENVFYAALISSLGVSLLNIYFKKNVAIGDSKRVARISAINNIGSIILALGVTLFFIPHSINVYIWTYTAAKIVLFIYLVYVLNVFSQKIIIYKQHLIYAFNFSLPRWIFTASILLLNQFDRIMLTKMQGLESTAIYSVAYNIGMLVTLFISAVSPSITPNYFKLLKENNTKEIDRLNILLSLVTLYICLCLILFSPFILKIVAPRQYQVAMVIIPIIIYGYAIHSFSSIYGRIFDYVKKSKYLSIASTTALALNIVLNLFLIKKFGYLGAAYSTTFSFLLMLILLWYFSKYKIKIHTTNILHFTIPFIVFILVTLPYNYINVLYYQILYILISLTSIAIIYFYYYKKLKTSGKF